MLKDIKHESTDTNAPCGSTITRGSFYSLILCLDIRPLRANHVSLHDLQFVFVMPAIVVS